MDGDTRRPPSPPRRTTIEIPLYSVRKYVPGSGPPPRRISLLPPHDSTAYIIDRFVLPRDEDMTETSRRLIHYHIGFTDAPHIKIFVPCNKILDYVSPRELEDWEYRNSERKEEERERELAEKSRPGGAKKPGRPPKAPVETKDVDEVIPSSADGALLLAQEVAGPSLSTPQKRRLGQFYEDMDGGSHTESDDAAGCPPLSTEDEADDMDDEAEVYRDSESVDPLALDNDDGDPDATWRTRSLAPPRESLCRASTPMERVSTGSVSGASISTSNPPSSAKIRPAWAHAVSQRSTSRDSPGVASQSSRQPKHNGVSQPMSGTPQPPKSPTPTALPVQTFRATNGVTKTPTQTPTPQPTANPAPASNDPASKRKAQPNGVETPLEIRKKPKKQKVQEEPAAEPEEWEVKELLDDDWVEQDGVKVHRYLVLWKGDWPEDQNPTWEPAENVLDRSLIKRYEKKKREGLLKPYQKAKKKTSSQLWPAAKYSSVAEAFDAGINDELTGPAGDESDEEPADEMFLVTENAAELTANGVTQARSPMFRSFDSSLAGYHQAFSRG